MTHANKKRWVWWSLPFAIIVLLILLWEWNWFRPMVERQLSSALDRPVHIADLDVRLSRRPTITLSGLSVENPEGFAPDVPALLAAQRIEFSIGLRELFDSTILLPSLVIDAPKVELRQNPEGARNWQFELPASEPSPDPWTVQIDALTIHHGTLAMVDQPLKADFAGTFGTTPAADGEPRLSAKAKGRYNGQPFEAKLLAGSVLRLREPSKPYPVDFSASAGPTRMALKGSLLDPAKFAGAKLRLRLEGEDFAALSAFGQLPLPHTPPYRLEGDFDYTARRILFKDFKGVVGESDMAGDLSVLVQKPRPKLIAKVRSRQVRLVDLSGLIGAEPNAEKTAAADDGRLLPADPIDVPRLQNADVDFTFSGDRIVGEKLPFDRLAIKLTIDDGVMRVSPVDLGIGEGALRLYATLDPRGEQLGLEAKAELRKVDIAQLMGKTGYRGSGRIGGLAALTGKGRSAAELLGGGNGELKLAMVGGDFSSLLLDLAGLDFGNALLRLIGVTPRTEVRCLIGDFELRNGLLDTRSFVLDTGTTNVLLDGGLSFKDETLKMRLSTQPKRANIGRLKAPIHIGGTFSDPSIRPDFIDLGIRGGAAVALGVLLTPLAAVLPTLQLGPGEDRDCKTLQTEAGINAPPQPAPKP